MNPADLARAIDQAVSTAYPGKHNFRARFAARNELRRAYGLAQTKHVAGGVAGVYARNKGIIKAAVGIGSFFLGPAAIAIGSSYRIGRGAIAAARVVKRTGRAINSFRGG